MKIEIKNILDFKRKKKSHEKISMVTCYDFSTAQLVNESNVDCILVGDSVAQVMHGHTTTLQATTAMMALHTKAVARGAPQKFLVTDMPFLATRKGLRHTMDQAEKLMRSGAQALKIEGVDGHIHLIKHLIESGIPIMGHLGLTPQSIHQLGGPKIQGKNNEAANKILQDALALQEAGCFSLVLECIPHLLSQDISKQLEIPTIGIGAGPKADGQVLVLQDLLGFNAKFNPKFLKKYLNSADTIISALNSYAHEVIEQKFPTEKHCYESN